MQRQLEDEVNLLAKAFGNTSEGVLILDVEGSIRVANYAAQQIIGIDSADLVGQSFTQFVQMNDGLASEIKQLLSDSQSWTGERELINASQQPCPVVAETYR